MDLVSYQGSYAKFFEVAPRFLENMWITCHMYAHHQFLWRPVLDSSLAYFKWSSDVIGSQFSHLHIVLTLRKCRSNLHACSVFTALFGHMLPTSLIFLYFVFVAHYKNALSKKKTAVGTTA